MDGISWMPYVAYFVGAAFGVLYPYLRKWLETGEAFSWKAIGGKVVVALAGLLLMPTLNETLAALAGLGWVVAFGMGLAATTLGHEAQKTPGAVQEAQRLERL